MELIKSYKQDNYLFEEYDNGTIVKSIISSGIPEKVEEPEEYISQEELYQLKVLTDLEYLKCLAEIRGGM